jgi:hypothetical protein
MTRTVLISCSALLILNGLNFFAQALGADARPARVTTISVADRGQPMGARLDSSGTVHLLLQAEGGPGYLKSTDGGNSFSATIPVVEAESHPQGLIFDVWDMAVDHEGRVHAALGTNAWKLKRPQKEWGFHYTALEPGSKSFAPVRNINNVPSEGFSLAADDHGNVTACWMADKLFATLSHDRGKTFGDNVEINAAFDPCNCCTTSATFGADGLLALIYREEANDERDMYLVLWNQKRNTTSRTRISGTPWKIDTCPMTYYSITRTAAGYVAAWPTGKDYDIYFARLDATGKVLSPGEIRTPGKAGHRTGLLALGSAGGETLIAWTKDKRLGWQLYDDKGEPIGPPGSAECSGTGVAGVVKGAGEFLLFR